MKSIPLSTQWESEREGDLPLSLAHDLKPPSPPPPSPPPTSSTISPLTPRARLGLRSSYGIITLSGLAGRNHCMAWASTEGEQQPGASLSSPGAQALQGQARQGQAEAR